MPDGGLDRGPVAEPAISQHIVQNIEAICAVHARAEENVQRHQRYVEWVTSLVGRAVFPYCILAFIGLWVLVNSIMAEPFDPRPFGMLQGIVSACALLTATVVLFTQTRQARMGDRRAHLDLQMSLLTEQKIAKLIALVEELRRDMPTVKNRYDAEATAMQQPADPQLVMDAIEQGLEDAQSEGTLPPPPAVVG